MRVTGGSIVQLGSLSYVKEGQSDLGANLAKIGPKIMFFPSRSKHELFLLIGCLEL